MMALGSFLFLTLSETPKISPHSLTKKSSSSAVLHLLVTCANLTLKEECE